MNFRPESESSAASQLNPPVKKSRKKLYGALGGAALALAVTFGGASWLGLPRTTNAQTATPSQTPAPTNGSGTNPAPQNGGTAAQPGQNGNVAPGFRGGPGKGGPGGEGRGGFGVGPGGAISAISGNTITITHGNNITTTVTVDSNTVYTEAGKTIALSDLAVGDRVNVRTTRASDGTVSVSGIDVVLDRAGGTISAVDANGLTLTGPDNTTVKVTYGSGVTVQDAGKTVATSNLTNGERVEVAGKKNSDGSITAQVINIVRDHLGGTVTAVNGNTITVEVAGRGGKAGGPGPRGNNGNNAAPSATPGATPSAGNSTTSAPVTTTKTITVDSNTTYTKGGQSSSLSGIAAGDRIEATGALSSDGNSLTALQVNIELPHYQGQVTSVNGSTIVISDRGTSRTIEVTADTKYQNGPDAAALSDVKTGENISAEGSIDSSGKMTATLVQVGHPAVPGVGPGGKGGPGPGGPGGHGKGR
jgi:hypothetical protein